MNGIICINKPIDFTSFDVIAKVRGIIGERKMGHAGTLDPMATGVLPIFMGGATKAIGLLDNQNKEYRATLKLGFTSDTEDIWGKLEHTGEVTARIDDVLSVIKSMVGKQLQTPPMYSAVSVGGKRLYDLARKGIIVERVPREIEVISFDLISADETENEYTFDITCSKGTYIRTLCADIGKKLKCGAVMSALQRTASCGFTLNDCVTIEELQHMRNNGEAFPIIETQRAFSNLPSIIITQLQAIRFSNGGSLDIERIKCTSSGDYKVFSPDGTFLGIGEGTADELRVKKLFIVRADTFTGKNGR